MIFLKFGQKARINRRVAEVGADKHAVGNNQIGYYVFIALIIS